MKHLQAIQFIFALILACFSASSFAAHPVPYDEKADAKANVAQALQEAAKRKTTVLLIFGANWCADCVALDAALKSEKNAALMAASFQVVKIDVGQFDKNLELAKQYGNPIKKGIPAAVMLSPDNKLLFASKGGQLASARKMSESGIYDFFINAAKQAGVTTVK